MVKMMATKLYPLLSAIGIYEAKQCIVGDSLFMELPNATHAHVERYFGDCFADERQHSYSSKHCFVIAGIQISLYMREGVWRFGAVDHNAATHHEVLAVLRVLGRLLESN
jgi:hypothetical protein